MIRALLCLVAVAIAPLCAAESDFGGGRPVHADQLPAGELRDELSRLAPAARQRAEAQLSTILFSAHDCAELHADHEGSIYFACTCRADAAAPAPVPTASPLIGAAAVPISSPPSYHSRLGASRRVYLDFNGATVTGTAWNTSRGVTEFAPVPYSLDADRTTFTDAEQLAMYRIWLRVSEDFAPFDVDVTTDVAVESSFNDTTGWVVITNSTDGSGNPMPSPGGGGVAYLSVFGNVNYHSQRSPAWVYADNLGSGREDLVAECVSHEFGHNLGLDHDGTGALTYFPGHGSGDTSWGPIMGTGYNRNVSQWSRGEYQGANNTEDDLAIIAARVPYRSDDHGSTDATGTAHVQSIALSASGVIEQAGDVDVVSFTSLAGPLSLTVSPALVPGVTRGGNLDVRLDLYNATGVLIAQANTTTTTSATLAATVAAGQHFLRISATGALDPLTTGYTSYASLGQWTLSGSVSGDAVAPTATLITTSLTAAGGAVITVVVTYADNLAMRASSFGTGDLRITGPSGFNELATLVSVNTPGDGTPRTVTYSVPASGGALGNDDNGTYTATMVANEVVDSWNNAVPTGSIGTFTVAIAAVAPVILTNPVDVSVVAPYPASFTVVVTSDPLATYQWEMAAAATPTVFTAMSGMTGPVLTYHSTIVAFSGTRYRCVATNGAGSATSTAATLTVLPEPSARFDVNDDSGGGGCAPGSGLAFALVMAGSGLTGLWSRRRAR